MSFGDAGRECSSEGQELQPGRAHYFKGRSSESWVTGVPMYAKVRYEEVYPGIDLVFYGNQTQIEYDFVVAPGADPTRIQLHIEGAEKLEIDDTGRLIAAMGGEQVIQHKPLIFQQSKGPAAAVEPKREIVEGGWKLLSEDQAGFELHHYDRRRALVIDPVIVYSSYLGGSESDRGYGIAVDHEGSVFVVGDSDSPDFPTTPGGPQPQYTDSREAFVTKVNPEGNQIVFATYLAGTGPPQDRAFAVDVDPEGNVYVYGKANSGDFPVTAGAFRTDAAGDTVFVTKLPPDGSRLIYSTFIGNGLEEAGGIVVDDDGFAYITGQTNSTSFPLVNAIQTEKGDTRDAFITKLNQEGSDLVFSTYYGGGTRARNDIQAQDMGAAITLDENGNIYIVGDTRAADFPTTPGAHKTVKAGDDFRDAFLLKLDSSGARVFATLLGGTGNDFAYDVAADFGGHAYVVGETTSGDFPITPGALRAQYDSGEGFVTKFGTTGESLEYSTFVGGGRGDEIGGVRVDTAGHAYVAGSTVGLNEIQTVNAIPGAEGSVGNTSDAAIFAKLRVDGSAALVFTGLGGGNNEIDRGEAIALDLDCQAYLTGETRSTDFMTVNPFQAESTSGDGTSDGFVTKIDPAIETDEPAIGCRGVVEANGTPILWEGAANSIMTVFGKNFAPPGTQVLQPEVDGAGRVTTNLSNTCMEVNGIRAPMYAVLEGQVNFQNPHQTGLGWASFRVVSGCGAANERFSEPEHIRIYQAVPAFFNFITNANGVNPIAAQHLDFSFAGPVGIFGEAAQTTPAEPGEIVILYGTGFGPTTPPLEAGQVPGMAAALTTNDVQVTIGDTEIPAADIAYIGIAPCCAGLYQLVVTIPANAPNGNLPVVLTIQDRSSPEGPYIAVQAP